MSDQDDDGPLSEDILRIATELAATPANKERPRTDKELIAEGLRIHENVRQARAGNEASLQERFEEIVANDYWPGLGLLLDGYCQNCLVEGAAWHALHNDPAEARIAFSAARATLPFYERMKDLGARSPLAKKKKFTEQECERTFGGARQFEALLFCLLFSDDRISANAVANLIADERLILALDLDPLNVFVEHMAAVLRGEGAGVSIADYGKERVSDKKLMVYPYRAPLIAFANGEMDALVAAVPIFERAFAARGRIRDGQFTYGRGRLGQAMSFDVYGAALLKLAAWHGVSVSIDTPAHPGVYIRAAS